MPRPFKAVENSTSVRWNFKPLAFRFENEFRTREIAGATARTVEWNGDGHPIYRDIQLEFFMLAKCPFINRYTIMTFQASYQFLFVCDKRTPTLLELFIVLFILPLIIIIIMIMTRITSTTKLIILIIIMTMMLMITMIEKLSKII